MYNKFKISNKKIYITIFILSFVCLMISAKLFINVAIYSDNFNTSPVAVYGGELWNSFSWIQMGLIFFISIISLFKINNN